MKKNKKMAALLNIYTFLPLAFPGERGMLDGYYIYQCTFLELHITTFQPCLELVKSSLHVLGASNGLSHRLVKMCFCRPNSMGVYLGSKNEEKHIAYLETAHGAGMGSIA